MDDRSVDPTTAALPSGRHYACGVRVAELLESTSTSVEGLAVKVHDEIQGPDGLFDFDATVRFCLAGMDFLILVEAKRHTNPIKRELVQVLHDKLRSVGAQKAVMIATAPYQIGATRYAKAHGIALATVTEGASRSRRSRLTSLRQ